MYVVKHNCASTAVKSKGLRTSYVRSTLSKALTPPSLTVLGSASVAAAVQHGKAGPGYVAQIRQIRLAISLSLRSADAVSD